MRPRESHHGQADQQMRDVLISRQREKPACRGGQPAAPPAAANAAHESAEQHLGKTHHG